MSSTIIKKKTPLLWLILRYAVGCKMHPHHSWSPHRLEPRYQARCRGPEKEPDVTMPFVRHKDQGHGAADIAHIGKNRSGPEKCQFAMTSRDRPRGHN